MRASALVALVAIGLGACASAPTVVSPAPAVSSAAPTPPPLVASSAPIASPVVSESPPAPALAEIIVGAFVHELDAPVFSLALGEPKVAALGAEPWLWRDGKWTKIELPAWWQEGLAADATRIFFGRDDLPRMMGARAHGGATAQLYLRFREGRWIAEKKEIAKLLDAPPKALWGVLGNTDPEVACKADDTCIVKRRTGWKTMAAGPGTPRVELQDGQAWALHPDHLAQLTDDARWTSVATPAPFHAASGFCAIGGELWVSEATTAKLHHFVGGAWTTTASPIAAPRGLVARAANDVWLAGATGLVHFDGIAWSRVAGPLGPLAEVRIRGEELWAAGESGVWSLHAP